LASATLARWTPLSNEPPAANYATFDTRQATYPHGVLDFDEATSECAVFRSVMPSWYAGTGVTVYVSAASSSATSGTLGWLVAFERIGSEVQDLDADGFGDNNTITATTIPGTNGQPITLSTTFTDGADMDSVVAGEPFRFRVCRDVASDNMVGDAEGYSFWIVAQ